jgi:hypothetical protein
MASATASTNGASDVFVHDAMIKPMHVAIKIDMRFIGWFLCFYLNSSGAISLRERLHA